MKLVCSKSNLLNGVQIVSRAVPNKTTMSMFRMGIQIHAQISVHTGPIRKTGFSIITPPGMCFGPITQQKWYWTMIFPARGRGSAPII